MYMQYVIQYSMPNDNRIAVSDWLEKSTIRDANSKKDALSQFSKNREGTWLILDCYSK